MNPARSDRAGTRALRGLYVITDAPRPGRDLREAVAQAIAGGARLVQYRDKSGDAERRRQEAQALRDLCAATGTLLIINDDVELARAVAADGVHLGRDDADLAAAREHLGPGAIIGVSCYASLARARQARQGGADYVAFGSFFASSVKPDAVRAELELLQRARRELALPIAAIGGIEAGNARALLDAGADLLAVISAVFRAPDIRAAAEDFRRLFED